MSHSNTTALASTWRKWRNSGAIGNLFSTQEAIQKAACIHTLELNGVGLLALRDRVIQRASGEIDPVLVVINTSDIRNYIIADNLLLETDWNLLFDRRQEPFARGVSSRQEVLLHIDKLDPVAGLKFRKCSDRFPIIVISRGYMEIFPIALLEKGVMIITCTCIGWREGEGITFDTEDIVNSERTTCYFCAKPFKIQVR